mgnify:CR=1 FL=1
MPAPPPPPTAKYYGCYNNNPMKIAGWDPNNLGKPWLDQNGICYSTAVKNNNKYYGIENNKGCLAFDEDSYNQLAGPTSALWGLKCSADYGKNDVHACTKEYPICTDYIANKQMGYCVTEARSKARVKEPTTNNVSKHEGDCTDENWVKVYKLEYPSELYSCNNYTCSKDWNGKYKTLEDCNDACKTKYTCDKSTWEIKKDLNGPYSTLEEASLSCKKPPPRFTCNPLTEEIHEDPDGEYATAEEASKICNFPLIIPEQSITAKMVNDENKLTKNIDGQIESRSNNLHSSYLNMIVWGAITILVIYMTFYYMTNRTGGVLQTLFTILICIIIIWRVATWDWNFFTRKSISFFSGPKMI